jgi:cytochrome c-type biogenesis protein CcmH
MRRSAVLVFALVLAVAAPAVASEERPTLAELEGEVVCPVCKPETLAQSRSPIAERMRQFIRTRIAAGDTKGEIKAKLVADFGPGVLAAPPRRGFNLLAWLVPLVGLGAGAVAVGLVAWQWSRRREPAAGRPELNGRGRLPPELEHRVDQELAKFER